MKLDVILRVSAKFFLPFMLLFALYVQFHGDFGPGGGFQAGVIAAATIVLYAIIFGLAPTIRLVPPIVVETMIPLGVLIFLGVGFLSFLTGDNYLNYSHLAHDQIHGQELGVLLVELGVLITVSGTMVAIFYALADRGRS
jgi:multicomponent Na+:H+ antiporter subunit B